MDSKLVGVTFPGDKTPKLSVIMFKRRGQFFMAACRGAERGCKSDPKRQSINGSPCPDCVRMEENETVEQVYDRLTKGDA